MLSDSAKGDRSVHCELCGRMTRMTGTKRCDRCWELERRIREDPELAAKILDLIRKEG